MERVHIKRLSKEKKKRIVKKLILCMCLLTIIVVPTLFKISDNVVLASGYKKVTDFTEKNSFDYLESVNDVAKTSVQDGYILTRNIGLGLMLIGLLAVAISLFFARSAQKREEKKTTIIICVAAAIVFFGAGSFMTIASKISSGIETTASTEEKKTEKKEEKKEEPKEEPKKEKP